MSDERVVDAAEYGLRIAGEKYGMFYYGAELAPAAKIVTAHVIAAAEGSGVLVGRTRYEQEIGKLKERSSRFERHWASAQSQADQQLGRVQQALQELDDHALAQSLAEKIGVILHFDEDAK